MRRRPRPPADRARDAAPIPERGISIGGDNYGIVSAGDGAVNALIQVPATEAATGQSAGGTGTDRATEPRGQVFISYIREDSACVDRLQGRLETAGLPVWRDTASVWPGEDWKAKVRKAITDDALVFLACFSQAGAMRNKTYQREELLLAVTEMRQRRPGEPWLIPVRFDACEIPDLDLGAGRTLASIQRVDLFGLNSDKNAARLTVAVQRILARAF